MAVIFGWMEYGVTDRWVLITPKFPHQALHNGRETFRQWGEYQNAQRALRHTAGPRRMPWPCQCIVNEESAAELVITPVLPFGYPRVWGDNDRVWREPLIELAAIIQSVVACDVKLAWMTGGTVTKIENAKSLNGISGFIGWKRGEKEPREPTSSGQLKASTGGADVRPMQQGETLWH